MLWASGRRQVPADAPFIPTTGLFGCRHPTCRLPLLPGWRGAMKRGVFFTAKGPRTVMRVICSRRYLLPYLSLISPASPIRRMAMLPCLYTPFKNKQKTCVHKITVPENTHSSNSANTPASSQDPRISGPHIYNNNDSNSLVKPTMPRIGVLPKSQNCLQS